jgi:hypothetical protein
MEKIMFPLRARNDSDDGTGAAVKPQQFSGFHAVPSFRYPVVADFAALGVYQYDPAAIPRVNHGVAAGGGASRVRLNRSG